MEKKLNKREPIKIEFFKGIIGSMLSIIIWEINGLFRGLAELGSSNSAFSLFGGLEMIAFFGIFAFPISYWGLYPLMKKKNDKEKNEDKKYFY